MRRSAIALMFGESIMQRKRRPLNEEVYIGFEHIECRGAEIGVQVETSGGGVPTFSGMEIKGGERINLVGTGVGVASTD